MKIKKIIPIFISSLIFFTSCSSNLETDSVSNNSSIGIVESSNSFLVQKDIQVRIDTSNKFNDKVNVSSSFSNKSIQVSSKIESITSLKVNSSIPQLITISDNSNNHLAYYLIDNPNKTKNITINSENTTVALVFMTPGIATINSVEAEKIVRIIKKSPEIKTVSKLIESTNTLSSVKVQKGLSSLINYVFDELEKEQAKVEKINKKNIVSGVEISSNSKLKDGYQLKISNHKKRTVDLYFNESTSLQLINKPLYYESIPSALKFINGFKTGFKPFIKNLSINNNNKISNVEVLGLGIKDIKQFGNSWPSLSKEKQLKYGLPIVKSLMFDFVSPILSIVVGFNVNKVFEAGLNKIISDLPIYDIINNFSKRNYKKAFDLVLKNTISTLVKDNAKLLRELLKSGGVSFRKSILKRINGISAIWTIGKNTFEFSRTLNAYRTTNIKSYFDVKHNDKDIIFSKSSKKLGF